MSHLGAAAREILDGAGLEFDVRIGFRGGNSENIRVVAGVPTRVVKWIG